MFQSTLPVWGATKTFAYVSRYVLFQSTLPVWGATKRLDSLWPRAEFQSTLPVWGATRRFAHRSTLSFGFNPRSPCGERRRHMQMFDKTLGFQSTLPVWGATKLVKFVWRIFYVSIHAPRVGSDIKISKNLIIKASFNPRSPCGERP